MALTLNQFEILEYLERTQNNRITQRELAKVKYLSVGTVNQVLNELQEMELLRTKDRNIYEVTLKGYEYLEPYRVKKAVFLAAGFGSRMVPITLNTPKPLVLVHGKRLIDTLLDAVIAANILDITIVRGYLGEQFDVLKKKYPMIKFVDNPLYNETNNISSIYLVRDQLQNAYVLESDLLLYNPKLIRKYEYSTNYLGIPMERSEDWCFEVKKDYIINMKVGGENCYQMVGISFWDSTDGAKMNEDIAEVFHMPGGKEKYWDQVALDTKIDNYKIRIKKCNLIDVVEIDTFSELKKIDRIYNVE